MVSYAQNFEDVMLWRALGHVKGGFYIDVGAHHPVIDSVSKAFYDVGWRGIHIEPSPAYADMLRKDRPDETVLQAALDKDRGILKFYEIPETGISTAVRKIAQQHKRKGFNVQATSVTTITLADVFAHAEGREIHWLKIDVEGFESKVLTGWADSPARPWIVVLESTLPLTQTVTHLSWEPIITAYGYSRVYFDGLNCFYVSDAHKDLGEAFKVPPNVFDDFVLSGFATSRFYGLVEERLKKELAEARQVIEKLRQSTGEDIKRLTVNLASKDKTHAEQEQALTRQLQSEREKLGRIERDLVESKEEVSRKTGQIQREKEALLDTLARREKETASQLLAVQERTRQEERNLLELERIRHERELAEKVSLIRQEKEALLAQKEREAAARLQAEQEKARQEATGLAQRHSEELSELLGQHGEREQAIMAQLEASLEKLQRLEQEQAARDEELNERSGMFQHQMEVLLRQVTEREKEVSTQVLAVREQAMQELAEQARRCDEKEKELLALFAGREEAINRQLQSEREEWRGIEQVRVKREEILIEKTGQAQKQIAALLRDIAEREKQAAEQLLAVRENGIIERAEQARMHSDEKRELLGRVEALLRDLARKEEEAEAQLLAVHEQAKQEKALEASLYNDEKRESLRRVETLLRDFARKEEEAAAQLLAVHEQAGQEKAEQARIHDEQIRALYDRHEAQLTEQARIHNEQMRAVYDRHEAQLTERARIYNDQVLAAQNQSSERELAFVRQLEAEREDRRSLGQIQAMREEELSKQADKKLEDLLRAMAKREQGIVEELLAIERKAEHALAAQARWYGEREHALTEQHQAGLEALNAIEHALGEIHCSLSWRITRPLRKLRSFFKPQNGVERDAYAEGPKLTEVVTSAKTKPQLPTEPPPTAFTKIRAQIGSSRDIGNHGVIDPKDPLNELLTLDGELFVQRAYQSLLGKMPDRERLDYFLALLHTGKPKIDILAELRCSDEPQRAPLECESLDTAICAQGSQISVLADARQAVRHSEPASPTLEDLMALNGGQFIRFAYQTLLGRKPDNEGLGYYLRLLDAGKPKIEILVELFQSDEAKKRPVRFESLDAAIRDQGPQISVLTDAIQAVRHSEPASPTLEDLLALNGGQFIRCAYQTLLGRKPDNEGLEYYLRMLDAGRPKIDILVDLLESDEAKERPVRFESLDAVIRGQGSQISVLADAGQEVRHSEPDVPKLEDLLAFNGEPFIRCAYQILLGREPDQEGFGYYLRLLDEGRPKIEILRELCHSDEAKGLPIQFPELDAPTCDRPVDNESSAAILQVPPEDENAGSTDPALTLNGLLTLHDRQFIECAYQTLLGREPDPEGLDYFLGRLRRGVSKLSILADLRLSPESKECCIEVPGLDAAIKGYRKRKFPLIGRMFKLFNGVEGESTTERMIRSFENQMFLLQDQTNHRIEGVESALSRMDRQLPQKQQATAGRVTPGEITSDPAQPPPETSEPEGLSELPNRARDIYHQLKRESGLKLGAGSCGS